MAHLKTADHCGLVLAKAAKELQALRPVHEAWGELAASKKAELQQLCATAQALQQEVADQDGANSQGWWGDAAGACLQCWVAMSSLPCNTWQDLATLQPIVHSHECQGSAATVGGRAAKCRLVCPSNGCVFALVAPWGSVK